MGYTEERIKTSVKLVLSSYGVKTNAGGANTKKGYTSVPISDLLVDCRCIKEKGIGGGTGASVEFQAGVAQTSGKQLDLIYELIVEAIKKIPERRSEKKDPFAAPFTVVFCCAWGVHRSVATKRIIGRRLKQAGYAVTVSPEPTLDEYLEMFNE